MNDDWYTQMILRGVCVIETGIIVLLIYVLS